MNPMDYVKKEPYKLYIDGKFVPSASGKISESTNPANNEVFASFYRGGREDVEKAIQAARKAYDEGPWSRLSARERSELLIKAGEILDRRSDEFAVLETLDAGKMYPSMRFYELPMAVDAFKYFGGLSRCIDGKVVPCSPDCMNYVLWQPCGVVGEILPWNGPLMMGCQKIASILAAGNTVVAKPPTWASLSLLLLAEVFDEAGFPAGVYNVVTGSGGEAGNALVESPDVDMVSMTGGTETGHKIISASERTIKDVALELGGKSPNVVFDDVDIDNAVKYAKWAFTNHSGQVCVSGTRLILQRTIYDEFLEKLVKECEKFVPGDGFAYEKGANFNTLVSKEHAESVWKYIELGKKEGARLLCGGEPYTDPELAKGNFVPPTIFADVTPDMRIYQEEIFGPVLCVTPFDTEEEALALANGTIYGLAGAVFTNNIKRATRFAAKMKAGQVYVNSFFSNLMIESPGTGWKQSGIGVAGIHKYMISKSVFVNTSDTVLPPQ